MNQNTQILELEVTQEDIDNAVPRDTYSCAVSQAARRSKVPNFSYTDYKGQIHLGLYSNPDKKIFTSPELFAFVRRVDAKLKVKHTKFILTRVGG